MKVEVRDLSSTRKEMEILVPKEDVQKISDEVYHEVASAAAVKGFRKGKAPRHILKMYYGDYIKGELSKKLVNENFEKAAKEKELFVVSMPEVENDEPQDGQDFKFTAKFDVKPEIKPEKYTGFELKQINYEVTDKEVDDVLNRLKEHYATIEDVTDPDYAAGEGDYVITDITCEANPKLNRSKMTIEAGMRSFFPGLEKAVLGKKAADAFDSQVEFPESHFMEEVRGQTVTVALTIGSIKRRIMPELDDEFAKKVREEVSGLDALKDAIREDLIQRAQERTKNQIHKEIAEKLLEANAFDVPESMVKLQAAMMLQGMNQRLSAQGVQMRDIFPDATALREETLATSEKTLRQAMLVEAIAKEQGLEASDEDLDKELGVMAKQYNLPVDNVRQALVEQDRLEEIRFNALEKKVYEYIISQSTITEETQKMEEGEA
jgi:trigger factor